MKKDLTLLGIYLNDSTINKIMTGKEGEASKLIYKIKTEMDRIKINFMCIVFMCIWNFLNFALTKYFLIYYSKIEIW